MASRPCNRLGSPPWSFAADAHGCIMVRASPGPPDTRLRRDLARAMAGSPRFVPRRARLDGGSRGWHRRPTWPRVAPCSRPSTPLRAAYGGGLRPVLTAAARGDCRCSGRGGETALSRTEKHRPRLGIVAAQSPTSQRQHFDLDTGNPIQGLCKTGRGRIGGPDHHALAGRRPGAKWPLVERMLAPAPPWPARGTQPGAADPSAGRSDCSPCTA